MDSTKSNRKRRRSTRNDTPPALTKALCTELSHPLRAGKGVNPEFSILEALCSSDPQTLVYITTQFLSPRYLFILYTISRDFHALVEQQRTSFIVQSALRWVRLRDDQQHDHFDHPRLCSTPDGLDITAILPFHLFASLCSPDPTGRLTTNSRKAPDDQRVRDVPTFRYLEFLLRQTQTIHLVQHLLLRRYHVRLIPEPIPRWILHVESLYPALKPILPAHPATSLAKLTLLMSLPTNSLRLGLIRNIDFFTHAELYFLMLFFIKLDVVFSDPLEGHAGPECEMRKLILSQKGGLAVLRNALAGKLDQLDVLKLRIRWKPIEHRIAEMNVKQEYRQPVLGVPGWLVGMGQYEDWGMWNKPKQGESKTKSEELERLRPRLLRPDELVIMEGVRRNLKLTNCYLPMMVSGYVDYKTLDSYPPIDDTVVHEEEWQKFEREAKEYRREKDEEENEGKTDNMREIMEIANECVQQ